MIDLSDFDIKSLIGIIIAISIAIGLVIVGSDGSVEIIDGISLFAFGVALAFIIQWIAFIPAYIKKTEKFYDITGTIAYISVVVVSMIFSSEIDLRSIIITLLVSIWTLRLGFFLFRRVLKAGEDKRFEHLKQSFMKFLMTWTLQGLWVSFTLAAALAAITSEKRVEFGIIGIIGLIVWLFGFGFESIADYQKNKFRSITENKGKFIKTGLWSKTRHPNYFGEIVLWIGIAIIVLPTLEGLRWFTLVSPIFVTLLITKVSGVPILERRADEKWGGNEDYEEYKTNTPVLIPKFF